MIAFLTDPKHVAAFAAGLSALLAQLAAAHGIALDQHTADAFTVSITGLALALIGSHTSTANAETHADAAVDAAKVTQGHDVPQAGTAKAGTS